MSAQVLQFPSQRDPEPDVYYPDVEPPRWSLHRARLDLPNSLCRPGALELLADVVTGLPEWDPNLHDDPNWIVPIRSFGLRENTYQLRPLASEWRKHQSRPVLTDLIRWAQPQVRLDALLHYARQSWAAPHLFDPDGWFGNELPIITEHPDGGLVVLDGTHRVAAAIVRGDDVVECYRVASELTA